MLVKHNGHSVLARSVIAASPSSNMPVGDVIPTDHEHRQAVCGGCVVSLPEKYNHNTTALKIATANL